MCRLSVRGRRGLKFHVLLVEDLWFAVVELSFESFDDEVVGADSHRTFKSVDEAMKVERLVALWADLVWGGGR